MSSSALKHLFSTVWWSINARRHSMLDAFWHVGKVCEASTRTNPCPQHCTGWSPAEGDRLQLIQRARWRYSSQRGLHVQLVRLSRSYGHQRRASGCARTHASAHTACACMTELARIHTCNYKPAHWSKLWKRCRQPCTMVRNLINYKTSHLSHSPDPHLPRMSATTQPRVHALVNLSLYNCLRPHQKLPSHAQPWPPT